MKWLDVMLGEINAKRDEEERRQNRRAAILRRAEAVFSDSVRPAADAAIKRGREAGVILELQIPKGSEDALLRMLLCPRGADAFEPATPFWECLAEPYHPELLLRRRAPGEPRPVRTAIVALEAVDQATLSADLDQFLALLTT